MAATFYDRLRALREHWLAQLEAEALVPRTTYESNDLRIEWSDNRLKLMQCIREASEVLAGQPPTMADCREPQESPAEK